MALSMLSAPRTGTGSPPRATSTSSASSTPRPWAPRGMTPTAPSRLPARFHLPGRESPAAPCSSSGWKTPRSSDISYGRSKAYRYLNEEDGCGFTMSTPRSPAGKGIVLWYKNHVEANYILEGEGSVEDLTTGEKWDLAPGTMYVVGPKDRHQTMKNTDTYLLSVFNPPLVGGRNSRRRG